jgi:hypothetical protein
VDALESHVVSLASGRPDIPFRETGLRTELAHGLSSRLGQNRADVVHQALDPVVVAAPFVAVAGAAVAGARALVRAAR